MDDLILRSAVWHVEHFFDYQSLTPGPLSVPFLPPPLKRFGVPQTPDLLVATPVSALRWTIGRRRMRMRMPSSLLPNTSLKLQRSQNTSLNVGTSGHHRLSRESLHLFERSATLPSTLMSALAVSVVFLNLLQQSIDAL
jgi:hypothetical protein